MILEPKLVEPLRAVVGRVSFAGSLERIHHSNRSKFDHPFKPGLSDLSQAFQRLTSRSWSGTMSRGRLQGPYRDMFIFI